MGVLFSRAKLTTDSNISTVQEYTTTDNAVLPPIMGITKIANDGQAQKISIPYMTTSVEGSQTTVNYKTVVQPIGQEGWLIKLQTTLKATDSVNEVDAWQSVDTGQLLLVRSNQCDENGAEDSGRLAYTALPPQTPWYVDKITISAIKGSVNMARMELALVRCWLS